MSAEAGLFDMARQPLSHGDLVDVQMSWGEVWHCEVLKVVHEAGWPRVRVHRRSQSAEDSFEVDVARCRLVQE